MRADGREMIRTAASLTVTCAAGAAILGAVYVGTERYQRAATLAAERRAIAELLQLPADARVTEVRQYLAAGAGFVVYDAAPFGSPDAPAREVAFTLDGVLARQGEARRDDAARREWRELGRIFVVRGPAGPDGFVGEGLARGYKNRIRFLVGLTPDFELAGVRVVEHEEDPGLGAEVATPEFSGQFRGRSAAEIAALGVTRDPMPEDWRAALAALPREAPARWRERFGTLLDRERARPVYAVTGATISSRALTDGVRATVDHFRRRWGLLQPYLEKGA